MYLLLLLYEYYKPDTRKIFREENWHLCRCLKLPYSNIETVHLRLGLEPMCWDSNPAKTHSLPTEITHLVSGFNEAQFLDVTSQKEFSER